MEEAGVAAGLDASVPMHALLQKGTEQFSTGAIASLAACEFDQVRQQDDQRVRWKFCQPLAAGVRQHHATLAAGNFYQARPMMPEHDVRAAVARKLGPSRCAA